MGGYLSGYSSYLLLMQMKLSYDQKSMLSKLCRQSRMSRVNVMMLIEGRNIMDRDGDR